MPWPFQTPARRQEQRISFGGVSWRAQRGSATPPSRTQRHPPQIPGLHVRPHPITHRQSGCGSSHMASDAFEGDRRLVAGKVLISR